MKCHGKFVWQVAGREIGDCGEHFLKKRKVHLADQLVVRFERLFDLILDFVTLRSLKLSRLELLFMFFEPVGNTAFDLVLLTIYSLKRGKLS